MTVRDLLDPDNLGMQVSHAQFLEEGCRLPPPQNFDEARARIDESIFWAKIAVARRFLLVYEDGTGYVPKEE